MDSIPLINAEDNSAAGATVSVDEMLDTAEHMAMTCTGCGLCAKDCKFLQKHGNPGEIAQGLYGGSIEPKLAYACSMCGLCGAVCPVKMEPRILFKAMRRQAVRDGVADLKPYKRLLSYEAIGASPRYSFHHLPDGCKSVLFPGCNLPGTRPATARWLIETLRGIDPALGVVLDCCHKPSEDLGREDHFRAMFEPLKTLLTRNGVERVLVACPNCFGIFKSYAPELEIVTVYQELAGADLIPARSGGWQAIVHDPCAIRDDAETHAAVRKLVDGIGGQIKEAKHSGKKTICCGEGGAVGFIDREIAGAWTAMRKDEAAGNPVVTYCGGCAGMLGRSMETLHVLDLLANPDLIPGKRPKTSGWPWTYLNRLRLKKELAGLATGGVSGPR